jgi:hypothetical protein
MDYSRVKQYTAIYDNQRQFVALQEQGLQAYMPLGVLPVVADRNFDKITNSQLEDIARAAGIALMNVQAVESSAKALDQQYGEFLKSK